MLPQTYELLASHEGKIASISGATQIRAGVIRPEIIIPVDEQIDALKEDEEETLIEPLKGMKVRVISEPYYGAWGEVHTNGSKRVDLDNGTTQDVVEILLSSGQTVLIGENNLLIYGV
jgi:hypothetical protein